MEKYSKQNMAAAKKTKFSESFKNKDATARNWRFKTYNNTYLTTLYFPLGTTINFKVKMTKMKGWSHCKHILAWTESVVQFAR